ncbi:MAG: diguanylate cyclase [Lachnospiraceae bacterium]|nr:diguanylate cyclase [Lachnospiraceae bacterium]
MNKKTESGNLLMSFAIFLSVVCVAVGVMLVRETGNISAYNKQLIDLQDDHIVYVQVARYLRSGSDILTENCRNFVITGNRDSMTAYFKEIEEERHREKAMMMLAEIDTTADADTKLSKAKVESDELLQVEYHAMALTALANGYYNDDLPQEILFYDFEPYEESVTPQEQLDMARALVFSNTYENTKTKIYDYSDAFVDEEIADINQRYNKISADLAMSVRYQRILTYVFSALLLATILLLMKLNSRSVARGKQLERLNDKLTKQKDELVRANHEIEEANNAKNIFLSRMSNAIRSPINKIISIAERGNMNAAGSGNADGYYDQIDHTAQILLELVNDVLTLGRSENGMVRIQNAPVNMSNFAHNCAGLIEGQVNGTGITFVNDTGLMLHPNVVTDELHLRQAILNIVDNAVKFTPEDGSITFRIYEDIAPEGEADRAVYYFEVEDTGVGMTEQYVSHIFDSFSKESDTDVAEGGLGIGMSITKRYIEMMGGSINVESELQKGTKFTIRLPLEKYRTVAVDEDSEGNFRLAGSRILIAEDNELNMEIARTMLIAEGAEVIPAENGMVALSLFKASEENSIDAILMDVAMPMIDGLTVTKEIRAMQRGDAQTVPIIGMVAGSSDEDIKLLLDSGMNDHISKPVNVTQLVKTLISAMRRQSNDLAVQLEKALRDANTDGLTGVKNRNAFELASDRLDVEIGSEERVEFAIVICDVNGLKEINDNVGHDEGNKLLINACRLICRTFTHSPVFRIGGDEFVAILRNNDYEIRDELVGGLLERMTSENYDPLDYNNVSFALGMAVYDPNTDENTTAVFRRADAVMYEHKKAIKGEGNVR